MLEHKKRGKGNIRLFVEDEDITTTFENSVSSREPSETATDNNDLCHFYTSYVGTEERGWDVGGGSIGGRSYIILALLSRDKQVGILACDSQTLALALCKPRSSLSPSRPVSTQ